VPELLTIDKRRMAALIMDYQNRQLSSYPQSFKEEILAGANRVLDGARKANVPVFFSEFQRGEPKAETSWNTGIPRQPGELMLTRATWGPFAGTNLNEILRKLDVNTLVLMGISTSGCVLSTVRCGFDIGYKFILLSDCCHDPDAEVHRVLMEKVYPRQASVVTSGEFLSALEI